MLEISEDLIDMVLLHLKSTTHLPATTKLLIDKLEGIKRQRIKRWVSGICEDGKEIRFEVGDITQVDFGETDLYVFMMGKGWKNSIYFSLPTSSVKNAEAGRFWDINVVTKEELEKLRVKLQEIVKEKTTQK